MPLAEMGKIEKVEIVEELESTFWDILNFSGGTVRHSKEKVMATTQHRIVYQKCFNLEV